MSSDGKLYFPKTHDGDDVDTEHSLMESDDNTSTYGGLSSTTSEGVPSPSTVDSCSSRKSSAVPTPPDITPLLHRFDLGSTDKPVFNFSGASATTSQSISFNALLPSLANPQRSSGGLSSGGKKKKAKSQPPKSQPSKSRPIKFHEYKGPPSAGSKSVASSPVPGATGSSSGLMSPPPPRASTPGGGGTDGAYNAMLQQQKLLLQWQREVQSNLLSQPCAAHRTLGAGGDGAVPLTSPSPGMTQSPGGGSFSSLSSPGSFSSGVVSPQQLCATPRPLVSVTPQPSRLLTPVTPQQLPQQQVSPAPTPSPASTALLVPVVTPVPPAPPPPPLPKMAAVTSSPASGVIAIQQSPLTTIPRSIAVVMKSPLAADSVSETGKTLSTFPVARFPLVAAAANNNKTIATKNIFPTPSASSTPPDNGMSMTSTNHSTFPATLTSSNNNNHINSSDITTTCNVSSDNSTFPTSSSAASSDGGGLMTSSLVSSAAALSGITPPAAATSSAATSITAAAAATPRITRLEDLKVKHLKEECKKRGFPVSGPKPKLLEKLAHLSDEIVAEYQAMLPQPGAGGGKLHSAKKTSPPNSGGVLLANQGNVFASQMSTDDVSMMPISPPVSPNDISAGAIDLNASIASVMSHPLSPQGDDMEVAQAPVVASSSSVDAQPAPSLLAISAKPSAPAVSATPMHVDPTSRPPSVTPMEMDVDSSTHAHTTSQQQQPEAMGASAELTQLTAASDVNALLQQPRLGIAGGVTRPTATAILTSVPSLGNGKLGTLTLSKPLIQAANGAKPLIQAANGAKPLIQAANGAKPLQIQLTPLSHPNKPTTAILKQVSAHSRFHCLFHFSVQVNVHVLYMYWYM